MSCRDKQHKGSCSLTPGHHSLGTLCSLEIVPWLTGNQPSPDCGWSREKGAEDSWVTQEMHRSSLPSES